MQQDFGKDTLSSLLYMLHFSFFGSFVCWELNPGPCACVLYHWNISPIFFIHYYLTPMNKQSSAIVISCVFSPCYFPVNMLRNHNSCSSVVSHRSSIYLVCLQATNLYKEDGTQLKVRNLIWRWILGWEMWLMFSMHAAQNWNSHTWKGGK